MPKNRASIARNALHLTWITSGSCKDCENDRSSSFKIAWRVASRYQYVYSDGSRLLPPGSAQGQRQKWDPSIPWGKSRGRTNDGSKNSLGPCFDTCNILQLDSVSEETKCLKRRKRLKPAPGCSEARSTTRGSRRNTLDAKPAPQPPFTWAPSTLNGSRCWGQIMPPRGPWTP